MKSKLLVLLLMTLAMSHLFAGPVDLATAKKVGAGFAQTTVSSVMRSDELNLVKTTDDYYVFNIGSTGFVIVSADDRFRPIVGYSNEGCFPVENPSPEMMYYLDNLSEGRHAALRAAASDSRAKEEWALLLAGNPLPSRNGGKASIYLMTTKWNQNAPYNKFCPGNSYAGCVATAMSQVMNYWKYPEHGWGNHTYTHYAWGQLSANFAETHYDFDLMPNSISNSSATELVDAVALFMYHCGIAVDMDYSTDGSGAYSQDVPEAVLKYFGYSNRCRLNQRDAFSLAEFQALIKDQIDMGWPCYYSGSDTNGQGGHAFVCDGYDDNDMFHFNWGWSGSGNAFYAIDELNVSGYAFNSGQAVITNFVPEEVFLNTAKAPDYFTAVPNGDDDFSVTLSWVNPSATLDGKPLSSLDQIVVTRDGVVVGIFDNPEPGAAMTEVIPTGLPAMVNYMVYAVCNGREGRKARVDGVNLGPVCNWTVRCFSPDQATGSQGMMTLYNPAGAKLGEFIPQANDQTFEVEVPQGRITMSWTAPSDGIYLELSVMDAESQPVFAYTGPSGNMPTGIFYEIVNTCGGKGSLLHPTNLTAQVVDENVQLQWTGIPDPGYGYNIYRDGYFYTMVADTTSYTDFGAALKMHSYFITAFCVEGETDPSNTCCAVIETPETCPRNFDGEMIDGNKITLTWDLPLNPEGIGAIAIYSKEPGEDYKLAKMLDGTATKYTFRNQSLGKKYNFMLLALYGNDGEIESSPARTLRHPELCFLEINATHLPSGLTLESQGEGMAALQWDPALLAESYNLYRNGELYKEGLTETQYTDTLTDVEQIQVYYVTGVVNGVESSPSNKAWWGNVSVPETEAGALTVFPNPTRGTVLIQAEALQQVEVYSMSGQLLLRRLTSDEETTINLSGQSQGIYYLRVQTEKGIFVRKVILMQ